MESEQAKILLSAYRPGRDDVKEDALLAEALALAASDPALGQWFANQTERDQSARAALRSIIPPAHLQESILASARVIPFPVRPQLWSNRAWLAVAAALALIVGGGLLFSLQGTETPFAKVAAEVPRMTAEHNHPFVVQPGETARIQSWFAAQGGPSGFTIPAGLREATEIGCEVATIGRAKVSIVCFDLPGGPVHLYIVDRAQISGAPPVGVPEIHQEGAYATASWSDEGHSYVLAEEGSTKSLLRFL